MRFGVVAFCSLRVNGVRAAEGVRLLKEEGFIDSIGLHLNLTEGNPVADGASTLLRGSEPIENEWEATTAPLFLGKVRFSQNCQAGTISPLCISREARAQVSQFLEFILLIVCLPHCNKPD